MPMLGVMRGAVNGGAGFVRLRREVHSGVVNTDPTPDVQIVSPLDDFLSRHRSCKALITFSELYATCRKDFYGKAANYFIEFGGGIITYIFAAEEIARQFTLAIATCDRATVHQSVRTRRGHGKLQGDCLPLLYLPDADAAASASVAASASAVAAAASAADADAVVAAAVAAAALVFAAAAAHAYADGDVTRSDADAHPNAFDAAAYAASDDANADANMPNVACHLARANASVDAVA
jgi:hypothetical protein